MNFKLKLGNYDVVKNTNKKYIVPSYWDIGRVYKTLIIKISNSEEEYINKFMEVMNSWIIDKIDNYNSSMYYENPSYLFACYIEGRTL